MGSTPRIRFWLGALAVTLAGVSAARAQLTLTGTTYTQSFDGVGTGLPTGFDVRTGATTTSLGTLSTFTTAQTTWATATGAFANAASSDGLTATATTAQQNASTDRVISIQQTGSFGDPGAAIDFNINASSATFSGTGTALAFSLQMLSVQTRSTTYSIQYGIGSAPTSFTLLGTYTDPGTFGSTPFTFTGNQLAALSGVSNAFIRIVALTASTGTGSRDRIGLDDLTLNYTATTAPTNYTYFDVNGATAGSGVTDGGSYLFSAATFNTAADGTGTTAAFTNGQTATFSAGADGGTSSYTVSVDTAVTASGLTFNSGNVTLANATGGSLMLTGPAITVATGSTATISQAIGGAVGLNKIGAGTLTLVGTNAYTGGTMIAGGILSVNADLSLGDASGGITLGGGTLQTTANISSARTLDGSGSLAPAVGTTLTISGAVGGTTAGAVTFSDSGTVAFTSTGAKSLGSLTFSSPATLNITGAALALTSGITTTQTAGTATVSGPVNLGTTSHTVSVVDGSSAVDLLLSGPLTGSGAISKATGAGTLALTGDNSGYSGTVTLGGTAVTGGTISVGSANALGTSTAGTPSATTGVVTVTGAVNLDTGTLSNDTGSLVTTGKALSIGALTTGTGAVLAGSDFNFTSNEALYKGSASQTGQQSLVVNNNTTFSGNFTVSTGAGTSTGLTIGGTGTLTLTGANTFTEPVTVSGVTVRAASATGKALGSNTALTVNNGGTLVLATPNQVLTTAPISLNVGTLSIASGANQGSGATLAAGAVTGTSTVGLGALTLSGNSTLSFLGTSGTAVFTSFAPGTFTLNVTGGPFGTVTNSADGSNNRLIFNQDIQAAGFLADITFNGLGGAVETPLDSGFYEISAAAAVPEPSTVLGGVLLVGAAGWSLRRRLRAACV